MNGIEVTLNPKCKLQLYSTGEVIFNYLGVLYKVKKHARGDIYRLYIHNEKHTTKHPKEWIYLMNIEEPVCLEEESISNYYKR